MAQELWDSAQELWNLTRAEVQGTRGWEERKASAHVGVPATDAGARARQRAYRERKRAQTSA